MVSPLMTNRYVWALAVAGVISILVGLAILAWPGLTLGLLALLFGVFAIVDGVVSLVHMSQAMSANQAWWPSLLLAIVGFAAGVYILANPGVATVVFVYIIAIWAIAGGLMRIFGSFTGARLLWLVTGVISVAFGLVLLGNPVRGAVALIVVVGIFLIIRGVMLVIDAFRVPEMGNWGASR